MTYTSFRKGVDTTLVAIAGAVIGIDMLLTCASVFLRPFNISIAIIDELPRIFLASLAFLPAGVALKAREHVNVDFLLMVLKRRSLVVLEIIIFATVAGAALFLVSASCTTLSGLHSTGDKIVAEAPIPLWTLHLIPIAGFTLLFLCALELVVEKVIELVKLSRTPDHAGATGAASNR